ncbi:TPA: hypothetical protein QDZ12_006045 [Pseudomonas putida]|uniref:hypothetical protein n=1 Tax=Pseudomonas sp. HD6515 TaxID=2856556 RepID=UPI00217E1153|nr:hypothetical protein [Pseudomonas sp. HD6515]ELS0924340.1 hypothetical protein [Pseudomonas putida]UWH21909.1 hypothetical protein KW568_23475 [Pseudomonas sp. HD6515]HDS0942676.1 hypothetical protein [Pseudomonas putida]
MNEVNFGNIAHFYSAEDMLQPDASYEGDSNRTKQTHAALSQIRAYFDSFSAPGRNRSVQHEAQIQAVAELDGKQADSQTAQRY